MVSPTMHIVLWVIQGILAAFFLFTAIGKTITYESMKDKLPWMKKFSKQTVNLMGILQYMIAAGLILPMALQTMWFLTPIAAIGICLTMIGAAFTHFSIKEYPQIGINVVVFALAAFIVWGRWILFQI